MVRALQQTLAGRFANAVFAALLVILVVGGALRLTHLNWDEYQHAHPDERHITMVATTLRWPEDLSTLLDPQRTTLNPFRHPPRDEQSAGEPRAFTYGHFPLYTMTLVAHALDLISKPAGGGSWADYDHVNLVGRALSGLFDLLSVVLIFLLGRRLYDRWVGLLAAALLAFTVLHIQLSHYAAFDAIMATWVVATVYFSVRLADEGWTSDAILAGLCAGLAIGSLVRAAPVLLAVGVAFLFHLVPHLSRGNSETGRGATYWIWWGLAALVLALVVFALTNPFSVLDSSLFLHNMEEQSAMVSGEADFPFTRQYRGTLPYLYHIEQQVKWGMGWPLGVFAFAGFAWVIGRAVLRRAKPGEWVMLAWVVPYFLLNGAFMVKFMRYMVIITPFLVLTGAYLLVVATRWLLARLETTKVPARVAYALPGLVVAATLLYAVAFAGIYAREHTWLTASRWIYENVPDGSVLAVEHWDDELPKSLPEPGMNPGEHGYRHVRLPLYEDDNPNKYEIIKQALQQADYIILATNRLYRSIPRLPQRYPMTIRYYDLLFAGELGFERVATFTSRPRIDGLEIVDDDADESFTVYDHPKPIIFQRVRTLSDQEIWDLLGNSWQGAIPGWTGAKKDVARAEKEPGKSLLLDQPVNELSVVDDFRWNGLASRSTVVAVVVWWLALAVLGAVALPLTYLWFSRLRGRGYLFARTLGLLLVGYIHWLLASLHLTQNRLFTLWLCILLVGAIAYRLVRGQWRPFRQWLKEQRQFIFFGEGLFAVAFLGFVGIRVLNPDLWQPWTGGEKSMEFAFLNAILKSPNFPPYDPYFAHGIMNYYYYGQYLVALLIKLTGIAPSVGFNLAVPTLFALTVVNAYTVVYNLLGKLEDPWRKGLCGGLLGSFFVAALGNLATPILLLKRFGEASGSGFQSSIPGLHLLVRAVPGALKAWQGQATLPPFDYWTPSRVISPTINEFPYWSFLFADLHPHMIGIPFTVFFVGLCLNFCRGAWKTLPSSMVVPRIWTVLPRFDSPLGWVALPLTLGALAAINTWDMPTYLGLALATFALGEYVHTGRVPLVKTGVFALLLGGTSLLLYWPFFSRYQALAVGGVGLVRGKDALSDWLTIWGFFYFLAASFILAMLVSSHSRLAALRWPRLLLRRWQRLPRLVELYALVSSQPSAISEQPSAIRHPPSAISHRPSAIGYPPFSLFGLGAALLVWLALIALKYPVPTVIWPVLVGAGLLLLRRGNVERSFTVLCLFTGLLITLGVEFLFMKDFLAGGDHYRMNTLFKFYIQVWILLGCGTAAALPPLWSWIATRRSQGWRWAWQVTFALLLAGAFLFLPVGTVARVQDRFPGERPPLGTLDGMVYMTVGRYNWPDPSHPIELKWDYLALQWLIENVKGTPVVAEGRIDYYREGGMRVASYTGLPTFLGAHQGEQRYDWQVGERDGIAREFFNTPNISRAQEIIRNLHVEYIYIGTLERTVYDPPGIEKFEKMEQAGILEVVYQNDQVTIYRVVGGEG
ncbi:MAG: DUF2298 domain-containing protein [Anaerolineae bacterium]